MKRGAALLSLCLLGTLPRPGWALDRETRDFLSFPFRLALTGYQRFVSPFKPTHCSMYPSDSAYARQAIRRYGLWRGALAAADRVHRCGHDASYYRIINTADGPRLWDPLPPAPDARP